MQYNGSTGPMHPHDHTSILLDQTQELRHQSHMLGWIMARLHSGDQFHHEVKQEFAVVKDRLTAIEKLAPGSSQKPVKFNVMADSLAGLLHAGKPYLVVAALVAGKLLGLGPSWIEPLIAKVVAAL